MVKHPSTHLRREIGRVEELCGGEQELALLLHVTPRSVRDYRVGKYRPSRFVCLQLARICRTLDGPDSERARADYWLAL